MNLFNALDGVKKIYLSAILELIGTIVIVIGSFITIADFFSGDMLASASTASGVAVLVIFGGLFILVGFIISIIGINTASKDEEKFKIPLMFVTVQICIIVIKMFVPEGFSNVLSLIGNILSLLVMFFVFDSIITIAEKNNNEEMVEKGRALRNFITILYIVSVAMSVIVLCLINDPETILIISLIASILSVVPYILYAIYLGNAKSMLESGIES